MELEIQQGTSNDDIIYSKVKSNLENSSNLLHKKTLILIETLHKSYTQFQSKGIEGVKSYTKSITDLCLNFQIKDEITEDDLTNYETLVFALSICITNLPSEYLRLEVLQKKLQTILSYTLKNRAFKSNYNALKYSNQILEKIISSRNDEELQNPNDNIVKFYIEHFTMILYMSLSNIKEDLQRDLAKSLSKLIREKEKLIRFTILQKVFEFIKNCINKVEVNVSINAHEDDDDDDVDVDDNNNIQDTPIFNNKLLKSNIVVQLNQNEVEKLLKFLSVLIQFLPFDLLNDILFQIYSLIDSTTNANILTNCFLCIDMAFATKSLAVETIEKFLRLLLNKNVSINEELIRTKNDTIKEKFLVSYIKAVSQILLSLNKENQIQSLKYFIGILSFFSEFLIENSEFVKASIFNSLEDLFNKLFSKQSVDDLFNPNKQDELLNFNIDLNSNNKNINGDFILEKIAKCLLYLTSSSFENSKIGFNLLLIFIEKINTCSPQYLSHITPINTDIIMKLAETQNKSELLKIFIGKATNSIPIDIILQYFPLGILDYEIEKEDYTDSSNVWIVSYMDKFLKENSVQNLKGFIEGFFPIVNKVEYYIQKLKDTPISDKEDMDVDENEEDPDNDECLEVNKKDTKYIRTVKIKRYKLILTQIMSQLIKYTNYSADYNLYVSGLLQKFKLYFDIQSPQQQQCFFYDYKEICFKFLYKCIVIAKKRNDTPTINVLKDKEIGIFFFNEILKNLLLGKLKKNEAQEGFNVISEFCEILNRDDLLKKVGEMIDRFMTGYNEIKNEVMLETKDQKEIQKIKAKKEKDLNRLLMRLEIINYIFKTVNVNVNTNTEIEQNFFSKIFGFFDQVFFDGVQETKNFPTSQIQIKKKMFDIFLTILSKLSDEKFILDIFKKLFDKKCLHLITAKQQAKLFEFITDILLKQLYTYPNLNLNNVNEFFFFFLDVAVLTKDVNKKVRNTSYEIIEKISEFLSKKNLQEPWLNSVMSNLSTKSPFIISAIINCVAKIFWDKRYDSNIMSQIKSNSDIIFLYFDSCKNNKEILKSLFIYIRVLLFIIKNNNTDPNADPLVNRIIFLSLTKIDEQGQKEFKVKIRNLLKNLITNFTFEKVKSFTPEKFQSLVQYVNKHVVVKKQKENFNDEENYYMANQANLDNSVMLDNDANLLDEEEEYIKQEFKKADKKTAEDLETKNKKIVNKIQKWKIYDDDIEQVRQQEQKELKANTKQGKQSIDQIEQLFIKDNVELNNFFYVNPFVNKTENLKKGENDTTNGKNKDVLYDKKQGKLIVKDLEKEFFDKKMLKKKKQLGLIEAKPEKPELTAGGKLLGKRKRTTQNVHKDKIDFSSDEDDLDEVVHRNKKMKLSDAHTNKKGEKEHYVKYSGNEYKNKNSKGDQLLKGKFEPFAYIQLNPKTVSNKDKKSNLKVFEDLMKNNNKK